METRRVAVRRCSVPLPLPICEAHHIVWLSRGGEDALGNLVLLCPNHHRAVHRTDSPLDFGDMAFDFGGHREGLRVNRHLGVG